MREFFESYIVPYFNFWVYVILMMIGMFAMITKNNLIKKLIGMSIFQTAIILFYVSLGVKDGATIPIYFHEHKEESHAEGTSEDAHHKEEESSHESVGPGILTDAERKQAHLEAGDHTPHGEAAGHAVNPDEFTNPLPHVLMLTAIVVGVATLGVALAVCQLIYREFGTLEESEILTQIKQSNHG